MQPPKKNDRAMSMYNVTHGVPGNVYACTTLFIMHIISTPCIISWYGAVAVKLETTVLAC